MLPAGWWHDYANFALGGGNRLISLPGFQLHSPLGWQISFALVGLSSFWAWHVNLKRYRTVADTPTSRIASAPQGYVELVGRGRQPPGGTLLSPITGLPCLWYRYRVERLNDRRWEHVESRVSHDTFGVDNGSDSVLVDPDGAKIMTSHKQVSIPGGPSAVLDKKADLDIRLTEWERDKAELLARFDANRDGETSLDEWDRARQAASAEVDRIHLDIRLKDGIHLIRQPAHGRPFLIANREVTELVRHFRRWSWAHLVVMLGTLAGLMLVNPSA